MSVAFSDFQVEAFSGNLRGMKWRTLDDERRDYEKAQRDERRAQARRARGESDDSRTVWERFLDAVEWSIKAALYAGGAIVALIFVWGLIERYRDGKDRERRWAHERICTGRCTDHGGFYEAQEFTQWWTTYVSCTCRDRYVSPAEILPEP